MKDASVVIVIGVLIVLEAICAFFWPSNDKTWIGQGARVSRLIFGVVLIGIVL